MHLTIGKADLARVLTNVGRVIESRNTIPILSHFRLVATPNKNKDGTLTITGTDLDIVATARVVADIAKAGEICVDSKLLTDIVKKAGGDITIMLEAEKLIVKSGRSRFSLATLPTADFPDIVDGTYDAEFDIDLSSLFDPVSFAISTEETRYYLNGIFFRGGADSVAVATDGHRLSRHKGPALPDFEGIIVPRKVIGLLPKGACNVSISANKIRIKTADMDLVSKLIDGTFPDYQRVIPKSNDKIITADRADLMRAADRVASISSEKGRGVRLSVASGSIALSARSDIGTAEDEVAAEYSGEPIDVGFNSRYLAEALTVFGDGPVTLALADGGAPGLLTGAREGVDIVLMPMRVS